MDRFLKVPRHFAFSSVVLIAFAFIPLSGCQSEAPEARLEDAAANLEQAREMKKEKYEDVEGIRDEIAKKYSEVEDAEQELAGARQELDKAERRLKEARARLDTRATDVALFRSIQKSLLDEDDLQDSAIRVEVDDRIVTLRGVASGNDARQRAIELAKEAPGSKRVVDQIAVEKKDSAGGMDAAAKEPTPARAPL